MTIGAGGLKTGEALASAEDADNGEAALELELPSNAALAVVAAVRRSEVGLSIDSATGSGFNVSATADRGEEVDDMESDKRRVFKSGAGGETRPFLPGSEFCLETPWMAIRGPSG